jgi:branched-chain amino acid transport system permease protein
MTLQLESDPILQGQEAPSADDVVAASAAAGRREPRLLAVLGALLLVTAYMTATQGTFNLFLFNSFLLAAIGASALNMAMGQAGLISVAAAGFLCTGSFTAVVVDRAGWPVWTAPIAALLVGAILGALFALPSSRLDGLYFSLSTLAGQAILLYFAHQYQRDEVGEAGFIAVPLFSDRGLLGFQQTWSWMLLGILVVVLAIIAALRKGRAGRAWRQIRDHELAAAMTGVRVGRWKILAMAFSSGLIALQGSLTFHFTGTSSAAAFTFLVSVQYIAMVLLGGTDTLLGPILGAAVIVVLPTITKDVVEALMGADVALQNGARIAQVLYGLLIILAIIGPPRGLDGAVRTVVEKATGFVGRARR